jgi:hypothetical protein
LGELNCVPIVLDAPTLTSRAVAKNNTSLDYILSGRTATHASKRNPLRNPLLPFWEVGSWRPPVGRNVRKADV